VKHEIWSGFGMAIWSGNIGFLNTDPNCSTGVPVSAL
jgi:hypothetical protein